MGRVTLVLGLQPGDFDNKPVDFFSSLGADRLMYQCGNLQSIDYSKPFMDRIAKYANGLPFLIGCDSHDFNNWSDKAHWDTVYANTQQYFAYADQVGTSGIVLNTEQENHLIPLGKLGQRSDPKFVWPGSPQDAVTRAKGWVNAVPLGERLPLSLWLTSAVQAAANPGFYPAMNAIAETAGGAELWGYMWEPGYGWGQDPSLPKRALLPAKYKNGKSWAQIGDGKLWAETLRKTFTQKVTNKGVPCLSFGTDTIQYYQPKIKAGMFKDYSPMMYTPYINMFKGLPDVVLIIWGDVWAIEPKMVEYTRNLIQQLKR